MRGTGKFAAFAFLSTILLLAILGCQRSSILGSGASGTSVFVLGFSVGGAANQDTLYGAQDTIPAAYPIYFTVRDSVTLRRQQGLAVSVNGKISIDSVGGYRTATFGTYQQAHTDTTNPWGSDNEVFWRIAKDDTGRAEITVRLNGSAGNVLRQVTHDYVVLPNGNH